MNPLLGELTFAMDGILVRSVLNDLDALAAVRLLGAVLGNHEQLADVILK